MNFFMHFLKEMQLGQNSFVRPDTLSIFIVKAFCLSINIKFWPN